MKNKEWTELELTIVYYVTKYSPNGCIKKSGGFMSGSEIVEYLGHGIKSFNFCNSRFKNLLGYDNGEGYKHLPTLAQKEIVKRYENTTVSQLRRIISELSNELSLKSNNNILPGEDSSLERSKTTPGEQLRFNF